MKNSRPYRSRRIPACTRCRARRSKCTIEVVGRSCRLCQTVGAVCSGAFPSVASTGHSTNALDLSATRQQTADVHIVPPMVAQDTQVLEGLLPNTDAAMLLAAHRKNQLRPVYHLPVPPRRPSPAHCNCSSDLYTKLVEQIEPYLERLIDFYFTNFQPCLPIIDAQSLRSHIGKTNQSSRTLLATFAAYMLFYWNRSFEASQNICLDQDFAWQVVSLEMRTEEKTNSLLSIVSAVLGVAGRPSKSLIHNVMNVARTAALSNSIGLNYDCSSWQISKTDMGLRQRLWWAVLIHDKWFHFAQGTPPLINPSHYDVALPDILMLAGANVDERNVNVHVHAFQCYIAFCKLTEIVGEVLPLIYHVRSRVTSLNADRVSKSRSDLDDWIRNLPKELIFGDRGERPDVPGLANLELAYLATYMLITRLDWYERSQAVDSNDETMLGICQAAAEAVADFVIRLKPKDLFGFWLPYNAQHFISAVTLLLRCALQTKYIKTRERCIKVAKDFVACLRSYKAVHNWDMAETALPQCETILKRIEEALPKLRATGVQKTVGDVDVDMSHDGKDGMTANDDPSSFSQCSDTNYQASMEELFPEVFTTFGDYTFFDQTPLHNDLPEN